ncbi:hypothetical protein G6011_08070 [Alternaria panax]|uniref:Uncharacterized protein n=1 Tax=Alternaria panax TaxID=48097 RepID=A0AAD4FH78_9PLEO|nr:hypothetical protein G6011_08070 [Alternaria panax]
MEEHGIDKGNTYNMDEKGFYVGIAYCRKRIFSKAVWESGERVVLFSPLSRYYTKELNNYLQRTQGLTRITKRDFYNNFWPA